MSFKPFIAILVFLAMAPTWGWGLEFNVSNMKLEKKLIIVKGGNADQLEVGDGLNISSLGGQCSGQVNKIKDGSVLIKLDQSCGVSGLSKGQTLKFSKGEKSSSAGEGGGQSDLQFTVAGFNQAKHQATTKIPAGAQVSLGAQFTLFSTDNNYCIVSVVQVKGKLAYLDTRKCNFEYEIRAGLRLEVRSGVAQNGKDYEPTAKAKENMYFIFGAGMAQPSYASTAQKTSVESLKSNSQVSHSAIALDLLGVYFPMKKKPALWGFVFNVVRDSYSGDSIKFEMYQFQIGPSLYYFFNKRKFARGPFLRGDVGGARFTQTAVTSSTTGGTTSQPSGTGFGVLAGGGYSFNFSDQFTLSAQLNYAYRSMGEIKVSTLSATLNVMF